MQMEFFMFYNNCVDKRCHLLNHESKCGKENPDTLLEVETWTEAWGKHNLLFNNLICAKKDNQKWFVPDVLVNNIFFITLVNKSYVRWKTGIKKLTNMHSCYQSEPQTDLGILAQLKLIWFVFRLRFK